MCIYSIHTSYCVAQQQPQKPGNLPVKKKATHIIPPAPGASKVTKLASGDHFVHRKLFCAAIWSKLCTGGRNRRFRVRKTCRKLAWTGSPWLASGSYSVRTELRPPGSFWDTSRAQKTKKQKQKKRKNKTLLSNSCLCFSVLFLFLQQPQQTQSQI